MYLFVAQLGTLMFHYWVLERYIPSMHPGTFKGSQP